MFHYHCDRILPLHSDLTLFLHIYEDHFAQAYTMLVLFSVTQFLAQNKGKIYHIFYLFDIYFVKLTKIHRFFHDFSNPLWYILPYDFTIFATFCLTVPFSHPLDMLEPHLRNPPPSQSGTDMSANIGETFQKNGLSLLFSTIHTEFSSFPSIVPSDTRKTKRLQPYSSVIMHLRFAYTFHFYDSKVCFPYFLGVFITNLFKNERKEVLIMSQSYTPKLKKKIVRFHVEEGRTYKSITAEYGVSKASISKWCSEFSRECQTKALENPDAPNEMELMKENLRLRKELEEAKNENLFLKKAAAFFAKEID